MTVRYWSRKQSGIWIPANRAQYEGFIYSSDTFYFSQWMCWLSLKDKIFASEANHALSKDKAPWLLLSVWEIYGASAIINDYIGSQSSAYSCEDFKIKASSHWYLFCKLQWWGHFGFIIQVSSNNTQGLESWMSPW